MDKDIKINDRSGANKLRRLKAALIIGNALIILLSITFVSVLAVKKTDKVLKNKVSTMATSLNVQMKLNLESYLSRMETIATLAFGAEEAYTYDATSPDNDQFEAINTEKIISDKLFSLCIMENFVDYGIVYRNNRTVGKISNGTKNLFGDHIFDDLSAMITRTHAHDGWATGYNDDFTRIYYVKKIHDNAILVISFYGSELGKVFDNPETMTGMDVRLTDNNYNVIYSSQREEVGKVLQDDIRSRAEGKNSMTFMDDQYLITVNNSGEHWYVICSVPTKMILNEKNDMELYILMVALAASVIAILLGIELSLHITAPVTNVVSTLDSKAHKDLLTGLLNKRSFEETAGSALSSSLSLSPRAIILLDLDNFKGVNDTLGHSYGDKVLENVGEILRRTFSDEDYLGRIGGDEFAVFLNSAPKNKDIREYVTEKCDQLCEEFRNNYTGSDGSYKISGSIGVTLFPADGREYPELYSKADTALYHSKKVGKDTYTFYSEQLEGEAEKK